MDQVRTNYLKKQSTQYSVILLSHCHKTGCTCTINPNNNKNSNSIFEKKVPTSDKIMTHFSHIPVKE